MSASRDPSPEPVYVDLRARLVPGDGAADLAQSLAWLRLAAERGFRRLYLPDEQPGDRRAGTAPPGTDAAGWAQRLSVAARALGLPVEVGTLAYLPLRRAVTAADAELRARVLPGTPLLFVHLPRTPELKSPARMAGDLRRRGFQPAVFAPELHPEVQRIPELSRYLLQAGAILVLDVNSLLGRHGHGAAVTARRLQRLGWYALAAAFFGDPRGPVHPETLRTMLAEVETFRPRARVRLEELLWQRAARLTEAGSGLDRPAGQEP